MPNRIFSSAVDSMRLAPDKPTSISSTGSIPFVLHEDAKVLTNTSDPNTILETDVSIFNNSVLVQVPNIYAYLDIWLMTSGSITDAPTIKIAGATSERKAGADRLWPPDLGLGTEVSRIWVPLLDRDGTGLIEMSASPLVQQGGLWAGAPVTLHLRGATQVLAIVTVAAVGTGDAMLMGRFYS